MSIIVITPPPKDDPKTPGTGPTQPEGPGTGPTVPPQEGDDKE